MEKKKLIKLKLKCFDIKLLDRYIKSLMKTNRVLSLTRLPLKRHRITILASPHVNIRAREHYELETHTFLLYLKPTDLILPPAGISYRIFFSKTL